MEELRSTDILDKEIQNDARKKAQAIVEQGKKRAEEILNLNFYRRVRNLLPKSAPKKF